LVPSTSSVPIPRAASSSSCSIRASAIRSTASIEVSTTARTSSSRRPRIASPRSSSLIAVWSARVIRSPATRRTCSIRVRAIASIRPIARSSRPKLSSISPSAIVVTWTIRASTERSIFARLSATSRSDSATSRVVIVSARSRLRPIAASASLSTRRPASSALRISGVVAASTKLPAADSSLRTAARNGFHACAGSGDATSPTTRLTSAIRIELLTGCLAA
jgi:hypothetical protein